MMIILWLIGIIFVLTAFILLIPVGIQWHREWDDKSRWRVSFLFGSVGSDGIKIFGKKLSHKSQKKAAHKNADEKADNSVKTTSREEIDAEKSDEKISTKAKKKKNDFDSIKFFLNRRKFAIKVLSLVAKFITNIIGGFRIYRSDITMYAAAENPYHLGIACAVAYPIVELVPKKLNLSFLPDFSSAENIFKIFGEYFAKTRVYKLMWTLILFVWRLPKIELYRFYRAMKSRKQ